MASPNVVHVNKENVAPVPSSNSTLHGNSAVCICLLTRPDSTNLRIQVQGYAPQVLKNNILPVLYFINLLSGSNFLVGDGPDACTSTIQVSPVFQLDGQSFVLIDTSGFDDPTRSDTEILTQIASFLATTYEQQDMKVAGLCGDDALKNVVIVTNMWGKVGREEGEAREAKLAADDRFFKLALDKGRKENSANRSGEELNREIAEQIKRHKEEVAKLQDDMEARNRKLQAKMTRLQNDSEEMETNYLKQNKELEEKMIKAIEVEKAAKREVEKAKKESEAAKEEAEAAREAAEAAETAKNNAEENHRRQIQELHNA
ncbi:hypothetical protein B0H13DRAFT_1966108, partial [Mycena leptocephala]